MQITIRAYGQEVTYNTKRTDITHVAALKHYSGELRISTCKRADLAAKVVERDTKSGFATEGKVLEVRNGVAKG